MSEREHRDERCVTSLVAEIVLEHAACQLRARLRFGGDEARVALSAEVVAHKRE